VVIVTAVVDRYDVVVVGGGAAGLSAALMLGRSRRTVLVIDAGEPRNAPADGVHGFLGLEGIAPGAFLEKGRDEVRGYGAEIRDGRVVGAERDGDGFTVDLDDGSSVFSRRLLVTTGLVDELPAVPGLRERWGRDVVHCPYCHGWEVRDQRIGVLATGPMAVHQALLFSQLTSDLTLFLHTAAAPSDEEWEQLAARGVAVVTGEVTALEVSHDRLTGIRLKGGTVVPVDALAVGPRFTARADLLVSLGAELAEHPVGTYVTTDAMGATTAPGVYAAGNVSDLAAQVISAAAAGGRAGAAINFDLIQDEVARAVSERQQAALA